MKVKHIVRAAKHNRRNRVNERAANVFWFVSLTLSIILLLYVAEASIR